MALARIEVIEGRSSDQKRQLLDAVHRALVDVLQVPDDDPMVTLVEQPRDHVIVPGGRSDQFTVVQITMFAGRSADTKRRLHQAIFDELSAAGVGRSDVLVVMHEPPMESWGVQGGVPASEAQLGFKVDI
jgi:phenylpyruvate tautomerase PptA (4-oxalocrotonate tautomerase family)